MPAGRDRAVSGNVKPRAGHPEPKPRPPERIGYWIVAGTLATEPYPCMCGGSRRCGSHCPCRGRDDPAAGGGTPRTCCGFGFRVVPTRNGS